MLDPEQENCERAREGSDEGNFDHLTDLAAAFKSVVQVDGRDTNEETKTSETGSVLPSLQRRGRCKLWSCTALLWDRVPESGMEDFGSCRQWLRRHKLVTSCEYPYLYRSLLYHKM